MKYVINVSDVDQFPRTIPDWLKIYSIRMTNKDLNIERKINEYEWAWLYMNRLNYLPWPNPDDPDDEYGLSATKQTRAEMLYLDLVKNCGTTEKEKLKKEYIDTDFVRKQLHLL